MKYKLLIAFFMTSALRISSVFAHVIIPPQFIKYVQANPQASVEQIESVINDRGTMDEIEGLSGMTSTELATRLRVGYGSGDKSELLLYQNSTKNNENIGYNISLNKIINTVGTGFTHVWLGRDHILYIISLVLILASWRKLLIGLSLFSITHSITLLLTILGYISFPSAIAEIFIAISIIITSIISLIYKNRPFPILTIYISIIFFGLFHGLGFARVFADLGYSIYEIISSLIGFTIGVEFAQISIIMIIGGTLYLLKNQKHYNLICKIASAIIVVFGTIWLLQRILSI